MLPLRQIVREMTAEKLRLGLTILAIVWATVSISAMLSIGEGLRQGLIRTTVKGNGSLLMINGGYASIDSANFPKGKAFHLYQEDADLIRTLPSVAEVAISAAWNVKVRHNDRQTWQQPLAVFPQYQQLTGLSVNSGGRWFNPLDIKQQRKVVVLGYKSAVTLFNKNDDYDWQKTPKLQVNPVGKTIKLGEEDFVVVGVLQPNSSTVEDGTPINYTVFIPFSTWQRFNPTAPIKSLNIKLQPNLTQNTEQRKAVLSTAKQLLARKYQANLADKQLIQSKDMLLQQKTMREFLLGLQSFLGIIGFVTLAVAGIGIANVMYATVKRATRDIGVRMAVGATPTDIKLHYLTQALLTVSIGGGLGLLITFGFIGLLQAIPLQGNTIYNSLGQPMPELSLPVLGIIILALAIVGIASAWFPAQKAASITPLEALQSE